MTVPHFRLVLTESEKAAVKAVLDTGMLAQGARVAELEQVLAAQLGKKFGCAVSSGTEALILALRALNIGAGDEVVIPSYTCTALWHAVKAVQAEPVLADIETETYNLDPEDVRLRLTTHTKAIIFPHMFGQPGHIKEVSALGLPVIEDIAQAYGAFYEQQPVGSFGTISIISFYATKVLGAGEGGALFTDAASIIAKVRSWREYDEQEELIPRLNAKMTDLEAALALARLADFTDQLQQRRQIYTAYAAILQEHLQIPGNNPNHQANYYRCIAGFPPKTAAEIIALARANRVTLRRPVYRPIHLYMQGQPLRVTEQAWQYQVSLPIFPGMTEAELTHCRQLLKHLVDYART